MVRCCHNYYCLYYHVSEQTDHSFFIWLFLLLTFCFHPSLILNLFFSIFGYQSLDITSDSSSATGIYTSSSISNTSTAYKPPPSIPTTTTTFIDTTSLPSTATTSTLDSTNVLIPAATTTAASMSTGGPSVPPSVPTTAGPSVHTSTPVPSASMPAPGVADYDDKPDVDDDDDAPSIKQRSYRKTSTSSATDRQTSILDMSEDAFEYEEYDDDDDKDVIYEDIGPGSETYDDIRVQYDPQEQVKNGWRRDVVYNRSHLQKRKEQTEYEHVRYSRVETYADLLLHDDTPLDIDRHYAGAYLCSAHPTSHFWKGPRPGYIRHDALDKDMKHGILGSGRLIATVSASHTSSRAIIGSWAVPSVNVVDAVEHLWKNQQEALLDSDGWVALCFIPTNLEGDNRYKQFRNFPRNCAWARAMHPVYSLTDVEVTPSDFVVFNIKEGVPYQLRGALESKWMVPLRTPEQKKATKYEWYHRGGGKERRFARYHNGGGKEYQAKYKVSENGRKSQDKRNATKRAKTAAASLPVPTSQPRRNHTSVPLVFKNNTATSHCKYHKCPGKNTGAKRKRTYKTVFQCEVCTVENGFPFFLCNFTKNVGGNLVVVDCHTAYHAEMCYDTSAATECSVVSDLTNNK